MRALEPAVPLLPPRCTHPRCARADEGDCILGNLARLFEGEAETLGAESFRIDIEARGLTLRAAFSAHDPAYLYRDFVAPRVAELGIDYLFPSIRFAGERAQVTVYLIDRADELGLRR